MIKKIKFTKERAFLTLILILSAVLNFVNLSIEGYANEYYAAGVKSMTMSLKNFFFVAFDSSGYVSIDKPPLGFWIQAISAKIFGFSGWSILLPQALAGVISVGLIYYLVKRSFGSVPALISALCLAITPVFVADSRNNTIDNLLVMTLLFACIAVSKAAEEGKLKYLLIGLALVGAGFNIKMLEAYMVLPALYIIYLLSKAVSLKKKIVHLVIGTLVLALVSFSWAFVVDLVPASQRPYVGSSTNNTVMELIFGHNGLERLSSSGGSMGGGGGAPSGNGSMKREFGGFNGPGAGNLENSSSSSSAQKAPGSSSSNSGNTQSQTPPQGGAPAQGQGGFGGQMPEGGPGRNFEGFSGKGMDGQHNGGGFGGNGGLSGSFGGQTQSGITRLFSKNTLSDQIVWFIPFAIIGFIAAVLKEKLRFSLDNKKKIAMVLFFMWLFPELIYFSFTKGLFHPYYLTMMAAPIAALTGIGISSMWKLYKENSWKAFILPAAIALNAGTDALMLSYFATSLSATLKTLMMIAVGISFIGAAALCIVKFIRKDNLDLKKIIVALAFAGTLVMPFSGSAAALNHQITGTIPVAGLELLSSSSGEKGMMGGNNKMSGANTKLIQFLEKHNSGEKYLLMVSSSQSADSIILNSNISVAALGGFSGSDNTITLAQFKQLVAKGEVRYVLAGGGMGSNNEIMQWVEKNGKEVSQSQWSNSSTSNSTQTSKNDSTDKSSNNNFFGRGMSSEKLYDLKDINVTVK